MKKQDFTVLKIDDLHPFPDNPFHLVEDELLMEMAESIKEFGVVTPIITRPNEDGNGYEVIAGQRRVRASQLAGIETIPAFVLPLDRDRAIITLVDSNIQRENILPSERAFAYKMKLEAMKRQGYRTDLTSDQVGQKLTSVETVAKQSGDSRTQVQRYIRLNELIPELQKRVDSNTLKFNPAVELSYLTPDEQQSFLDYAEAQDCTPSLSQAQKLKAASKEGTLTLDRLEEIMSAQKPSVAPREPVLNINVSKVAQYFPTGCTKQQMENRILKILESYFRQVTHEQSLEER